MKKSLLSLAGSLLVISTPQAMAHCEVPCGIYADDNVFVGLEKDQETIAKAMKQINELSKDPSKNANQLVRWVTNKEKHATAIQQTVAQYFLAQRVKLAEAEKNPKSYAKKLAQLHAITVLSMKCKQTTDVANAQKLEAAIAAFKLTYQGKKGAKAGGSLGAANSKKPNGGAALGALIGGVVGHSAGQSHNNGHSHGHAHKKGQ